MKDTSDIFAVQLGTGAFAMVTSYTPLISSAFMIVSTITGCIAIYRTFFPNKNAK
jgi:hypothetical protein